MLDALRTIEHGDAFWLIFCKPDGSPLRQSFVKKPFHAILKAAGLPRIRLYDLRHTAATLAVAAGASVKAISEQLGMPALSSPSTAIPTSCPVFRTTRQPALRNC